MLIKTVKHKIKLKSFVKHTLLESVKDITDKIRHVDDDYFSDAINPDAVTNTKTCIGTVKLENGKTGLIHIEIDFPKSFPENNL